MQTWAYGVAKSVAGKTVSESLLKFFLSESRWNIEVKFENEVVLQVLHCKDAPNLISIPILMNSNVEVNFSTSKSELKMNNEVFYSIEMSSDEGF